MLSFFLMYYQYFVFKVWLFFKTNALYTFTVRYHTTIIPASILSKKKKVKINWKCYPFSRIFILIIYFHFLFLFSCYDPEKSEMCTNRHVFTQTYWVLYTQKWTVNPVFQVKNDRILVFWSQNDNGRWTRLR